jgi:hypothetical protein
MTKFIVDIFIYTFAVFGLIFYIQQTISGFKRKNYSNTLILLLDDCEDVEFILNDLKRNIIDKKIADNIYVFSKSENDINMKNSANIKIIDRNELLSLIDK